MNRALIQIVVLFTLSINSAQSQQMQLEIIPLNHRSVDEVISVIRPLLPPGGSINGMNYQLIVKTTPSNLSEIKQILNSIDKPQRQLRISVKQDGQDTVDQQDLSLSGVISSGDVSVASGNRRSPRGGKTVTGDDEGNSVSIRALDSNKNEIDNNLFTVTTLDGQPAYIQTGQSVPIPSQNTIVTHNGVIVQDTLEYRDVASGFYVVPRLTGNSVTLLIAPQLSKVNQGNNLSFDIQQVETTVNGKLGQWMEIGGIDQSSQDNRSTIFGSSKRSTQQRRTVLIKVDEIK